MGAAGGVVGPTDEGMGEGVKVAVGDVVSPVATVTFEEGSGVPLGFKAGGVVEGSEGSIASVGAGVGPVIVIPLLPPI